MITITKARQELAQLRRGFQKDVALMRHQGPIMKRADQILAGRRVTVDQALDQALDEFVNS